MSEHSAVVIGSDCISVTITVLERELHRGRICVISQQIISTGGVFPPPHRAGRSFRGLFCIALFLMVCESSECCFGEEM